MTVLHDNLGNPIDAKNPLPVDVSTSDAIVPTDIQSHLTSTIQTQNAVSVALSSYSTSSIFSCDGFNEISLHLKNDASTARYASIKWSFDGSSTLGEEVLVPSASSAYGVGVIDIKAPYFQIVLYNTDSTLAHTMSAYVYLKA